jgi:hypothetical protein
MGVGVCYPWVTGWGGQSSVSLRAGGEGCAGWVCVAWRVGGEERAELPPGAGPSPEGVSPRLVRGVYPVSRGTRPAARRSASTVARKVAVSRRREAS